MTILSNTSAMIQIHYHLSYRTVDQEEESEQEAAYYVFPELPQVLPACRLTLQYGLADTLDELNRSLID